ncbi:MAG: CsbD family protein [Chlamydiota bacterium]
MNKDILKGNWNEFKGKIKQKWGKLTDDDLTQSEGKKDQLLGKLQTHYGWNEEQAKKEWKQFEDSCCECKKDLHGKRKEGSCSNKKNL